MKFKLEHTDYHAATGLTPQFGPSKPKPDDVAAVTVVDKDAFERGKAAGILLERERCLTIVRNVSCQGHSAEYRLAKIASRVEHER